MTKIKICGVRREEDAIYLNEFLPDYTGFIFAKGRKRYIEPSFALRIKKALSPKIKTVGVFVNEDVKEILSVAESGAIDLIQLHGLEDDGFISAVKEKSRLPVIKAFKIESKEDVERAVNSAGDFILLDNGAGGTGEKFNWDLLREIERPFFLAGGLDPENVSKALKICSPYAVDVSSGVETNGFKDYLKIKEFIKAVRGEKSK